MSWKNVQYENGKFRSSSSGGGGGGASELSDLDDVSVSGIADKDILVYNATTQKYEKSSNLKATVGSDIVPFRFSYDSETQKYGYLDGADTFHPFEEGGGGGATTGIPLIEKMWDSYSDPIEYTHTVSEAGQYMAVYVSGDGGASFSTTGDIVCEVNPTGNRQLRFHVVDCEVGDTIYMQNSNYSSGAYRGATAILLRLIGTRITAITQSWSNKYNDTSYSNTPTLSANKKYLVFGMTIGTSRSEQWYFQSNGYGDCALSLAWRYGYWHILALDVKTNTQLYEYLYGNTAGAVISAGYEITTD